MSSKLIGFFKSNDQAERAKDELRSAGFDDVHTYRGGEEPGMWESIKEAFGFADEEDRQLYQEASRRGATAVVVDLDDEDAPDDHRAVAILQRYNPIDLDTSAGEWQAQGWKRPGASAQAQRTAAPAQQQRPAAQPNRQAAQGEQVLPVVEEELQVGKRRVGAGGVRVYTRVTERPVQAQINLQRETARIERRPTDRPLSDADKTAFQERAVEVTESREEAVVAKQAKVVEEVVVRKDVEQETQTVSDTVRRTDVDVERTGANPGQRAGFTADDYAAELARDKRFGGREWANIETDARSDFERRYPNNRWDDVRESIRKSFTRASSSKGR